MSLVPFVCPHMSQESGKPLVHDDFTGKAYDLNQAEETRPNVFVVNNAAAYAAWYQVRFRQLVSCLCLHFASNCVEWMMFGIIVVHQTPENHQKWVDQFLEYLCHG